MWDRTELSHRVCGEADLVEDINTPEVFSFRANSGFHSSSEIDITLLNYLRLSSQVREVVKQTDAAGMTFLMHVVSTGVGNGLLPARAEAATGSNEGDDEAGLVSTRRHGAVEGSCTRWRGVALQHEVHVERTRSITSQFVVYHSGLLPLKGPNITFVFLTGLRRAHTTAAPPSSFTIHIRTIIHFRLYLSAMSTDTMYLVLVTVHACPVSPPHFFFI